MSSSLKLLQPPEGWSTIKGGICRASTITANNLPFLKLSQIRTVVLFEHPDSSSAVPGLRHELANFGISIISIASSQNMEEIVLNALNAAMNSSNHPVVITCSSLESFVVSVTTER